MPLLSRTAHRTAARIATTFLALVALAAPAFVLAGCDKLRPQKDPEGPELPKGARLAEVKGGDFRVEISATGKVTPLRVVDVLSKAGGEIVEMPYDLGQTVKAGELIVRLDPKDEKLNVGRMEAMLLSSRARLEKTRNEFLIARSSRERTLKETAAAIKSAEARLAELESRHARQQQLHERKLIAIEELEASASTLEQARTELVRARAAAADAESLDYQIAARQQDIQLAEVDVRNTEIQLQEAKERLADTEVLAPMDGVVTERKVEKGQVITSALSGYGGGTLLMKISDLSELFLVTKVDETDIGGVELGQRAILTSDSAPGGEFEGKVAHISPVGVELNSVVTFDVKIAVLGEGLTKLRPGVTAEVVIVQKESPATLWTQSEAVVVEESGAAYVEVVPKGGEPRRVPVEVGLDDGLRTEIRGEGLKEGDQVLVREREGLTAWERGEAGSGGRFQMRSPFLKKK